MTNYLLLGNLFVVISNKKTLETDLANKDVRDDAWWLKADYQASDVWFNEIAILNYGAKFDISDFGFVQTG